MPTHPGPGSPDRRPPGDGAAPAAPEPRREVLACGLRPEYESAAHAALVGAPWSLVTGPVDVPTAPRPGTGWPTVRGGVRRRPDVVLMPGGSRARHQAPVAARVGGALRLWSASAVIVVTAEFDANEMVAAARAGAMGYLTRAALRGRFLRILDGLAQGEAAFGRRATAHLLRVLVDEPAPRLLARDGRLVELTPRENDVLHLLGTGLTTVQAARHLSVTPVTIRTHLLSVRRKLRADPQTSVADLLRIVQQ